MDGYELSCETVLNNPPVRERLPLISGMLGVFILGALTVSAMPGWSVFVKAFGVLLAISFFIRSLQTKMQPSAEMLLYLAWMAWSLTGGITAPSSVLFYDRLETVAQIWVFIAIISLYSTSQKTLAFTQVVTILAAIIVGGYSFVTGDYSKAESGETRLSGMVLNANAFAFFMICAIVGMTVLWALPTWRSKWKYVFLGFSMVAAVVSIILSGSRMGLMGLGVFFFFWILLCYRKEILHRPSIAIGVIVMILIGYVMYLYMWQDSTMAKRTESLVTILSGGSSDEHSTGKRMEFYAVGASLVAKHPITGVGLNNFLVYGGMVAHSEYVEIISDTGIPGFLIYFSIFAVLWRRCGKISKYSPDYSEVMLAKLIRAFIITILITDTARWCYYDKGSWIILGSFIGYTTAVWRRIKAESVQASDAQDFQALPAE